MTQMPIGAAPSNTVVLITTLVVQALATMAVLTLPVVAPVVARALGLSTAYLGLYVALVYIAAVATSLMGGAIVRRLGAIRTSQVALGLCAVGVSLCTIPSVFSIAAGALLIGLGYGPITPASSHLLARTTPAHRMSLVFSLKQTGVPLGALLAGLIVPGLAGWISWQTAFFVVGMANVLCAVMMQLLQVSLDSDRDVSQRLTFGSGLSGPLRLVFNDYRLLVLAIVSFLFSSAQTSLSTYLVTFLHEDLSIGLVKAGILLGVSQVAGGLGRLLWGYLSDRYFGAIRMLISLALAMGLGAVAFPFLKYFDSTIMIVLVLILFGTSAVGWNGIYLAEVARQAPKGMASLATGGTMGITFLGVVFGPSIFGLIAELTGSYGIAFGTLVTPSALSLWLLWRYRTAFFVPSAEGTVQRS